MTSYHVIFKCLAPFVLMISLTTAEDVCRERYEEFPKSVFTIRSCSYCYVYLYHHKPNALVLGGQHHAGLLPNTNSTAEVIYPNLTDPSTMEPVCETLTSSECQRWVECCQAAATCCDDQVNNNHGDPHPGQCPHTWDGYSCWSARGAGSAYQECPSYLEYSFTSRTAVKICEADGTWHKKEGNEWTDYTRCLDKAVGVTNVNIFDELPLNIFNFGP